MVGDGDVRLTCSREVALLFCCQFVATETRRLSGTVGHCDIP